MVDPNSTVVVCVLGHKCRGSDQLASVLAQDPQFSVVYVSEPHDQVPVPAGGRGSVIVYDAGVINKGAFDTVVELSRRTPEASVLVAAEQGHRAFVTTILRAGARGCILRAPAQFSGVNAAVRSLAAGQGFLCPRTAKIVLEDCMWVGGRARTTMANPMLDASMGQFGASGELLKPLTQREREVLRLVAEGHTTPMIAGLLSISTKTVEGHRGRLMSKLKVSNVAGLVRSAIRAGMIAA